MRRLAPCWLLLATTSVGAQDPTPVLQPTVEDLGSGRYRIGKIVLDQAASSFTVPGRVLRIEPPLEYLAVKVGGLKSYESLLELDADGYQFNLACLLIGLTTDDVVPPDYQFDQDAVVGPEVRIRAEWGTGDNRVDVDVEKLITIDGEALSGSDWAYVGSMHVEYPVDPFLANQTGTLIGLAHDPASVIEHRAGVGIGRYGSVGGNSALLTAVGMELTLRIELVQNAAPPTRD